jgi:hypothetical protein
MTNKRIGKTRHDAGDQYLNLPWRGVAATACLLAVPVAVQATPTFTIPDTLSPGDHYRVVFLTTNTTAATSTSIATYNSFVSTDAGLNGSLPTTTWSAIASTATETASNNIACSPSCASDPIFLVNGTEVASSTSNLFSGSILTAISLTESGVSLTNNYAWTGSTTGGSNDAGFELGTTEPEFGYSAASNGSWADLGNFEQNTVSNSLYAISGDLVVPSVPGPGGLPLFALGGLLTLAARAFRRGGRQAG